MTIVSVTVLKMNPEQTDSLTMRGSRTRPIQYIKY